MNFSRLGRGEYLAVLGGLLLALESLPALVRDQPGQPQRDHRRRRAARVTALDAFPILRWLLLAAAVAPLILAWVILRDHQLSWPRGEMTAVVGMIAIVLVLYVGLVDRPGDAVEPDLAAASAGSSPLARLRPDRRRRRAASG